MRRIYVLVVLWVLLAIRVVTLVNNSGYDREYLAVLALFAWLGGLVTSQLYETVRDHLWERKQSK